MALKFDASLCLNEDDRGLHVQSLEVFFGHMVHRVPSPADSALLRRDGKLLLHFRHPKVEDLPKFPLARVHRSVPAFDFALVERCYDLVDDLGQH